MGRSVQRLIFFYWLLAAWEIPSIQAFTILRPAALQTRRRATTATRHFRLAARQFRLAARGSRSDDDNEEELVPVRRQRGRKPYYEDDDITDEEYYGDSRAPGGRTYERDADYDDDDEEMKNKEKQEEFDDALAYLDEVLDQWEPTEHAPFGKEIVPNALLDNIDPDGAADRFPELARDPRFWFELLLLIMFLDFCSLAGPQDAFPLL
jgi:hypothetical protein